MSFKPTRKLLSVAVAAGISFASLGVQANIGSAVDKALSNSPEFKQTWSELLITNSDIADAKSYGRPQVDVVGNYGMFSKRQGEAKQGFDLGWSAEVKFSQLLYNGNVSIDIDRSKSLQKTKYFLMLDSANTIAFDAVDAYLTVAKHRELVDTAKLNLDKHKEIAEKIQDKYNSGLSTESDSKQIEGRVALSETNYITAQANLNNAIANYIRVVGEQPPQHLVYREFNDEIVSKPLKQQVLISQQSNPALIAAVEKVSSENLAVKSNKAKSYKPEAHLYASSTVGSSAFEALQVHGNENIINHKIGIQVQYNLYRGGADKARIQKSLDKVTLAQEERNEVCLNLQRDVMNSNADLMAINAKIPALYRHSEAASQVRANYAEQFNLGSRTLLDVLDSENEYFQSGMAIIDAKYDKAIKQAEMLKHKGSLINSINNKEVDAPELATEQSNQTLDESVCPTFVDTSLTIASN